MVFFLLLNGSVVPHCDNIALRTVSFLVAVQISSVLIASQNVDLWLSFRTQFNSFAFFGKSCITNCVVTGFARLHGLPHLLSLLDL